MNYLKMNGVLCFVDNITAKISALFKSNEPILMHDMMLKIRVVSLNQESIKISLLVKFYETANGERSISVMHINRKFDTRFNPERYARRHHLWNMIIDPWLNGKNFKSIPTFRGNAHGT